MHGYYRVGQSRKTVVHYKNLYIFYIIIFIPDPGIISQTLFFIYLCLIGDICEYKYFSTSHRLLLHLNLYYRSL